MQYNPGASKGTQIVIGTDVYHVHPISYVHQHKMNNHSSKFKAQLYNKICMIAEKLEEMVVWSPKTVDVKKIYFIYLFYTSIVFHKNMFL